MRLIRHDSLDVFHPIRVMTSIVVLLRVLHSIDEMRQGRALSSGVERETLIRNAQDQYASGNQCLIPPSQSGQRERQVFEDVTRDDEVQPRGERQQCRVRDEIELDDPSAEVDIVFRESSY